MFLKAKQLETAQTPSPAERKNASCVIFKNTNYKGVKIMKRNELQLYYINVDDSQKCKVKQKKQVKEKKNIYIYSTISFTESSKIG